ncbi:universal stress protein [bacterium]|nr:universal stress protein [candidate division CSSED10-310 bacterium]
MYKHILIPINPKKISDTAIRYAFELASFTGAVISIVHASSKVFSDDEESMLRVPLEKFHAKEEKDMEFTRSKVAEVMESKLLKTLSGTVQWKVETIPAHDSSANAVVSHAEKVGADLIFLSVPRISSKWEMILGDFREWVIHFASCPVLVFHR